MTLAWAIVTTLLAIAALVYASKRNKEVARVQSQLRDEASRAENFSETVAQERVTLLNSLSEALFLTDSELTILFSNSKAEELFGKKDLKGRKLSHIFTDSTIASALVDHIETGSAQRQHFVLSPQSSRSFYKGETTGETAWVLDTAPLPDFGAEVAHRIILSDVTSQHQAEQVRKDFVANASHELRTPLAIIEGYLENLVEDGLVEDQTIALRFLKIMRKHAERISHIVEDMLVISRLESSESASLNKEKFQLLTCFTDVIERLEHVIQKNGGKVTTHVIPPDIVLFADRFYFTQVLFNLIENAFKQNPDQKLHVSCQADLTENGVTIKVSDNGVGIPAADLPFVFKRFYRVQKHHSQDQIKGTGLGLSIVKRAIEAHGGTITLTSQPGKETTFHIELPLSAVSAK